MRHLCWRCGLPAPELQYEVFDNDGRLVGRTDFAWPAYRLFGEFDGQGKYLRNLKPGQSVADVVLAEKQREDRIRELTRWSFVRVTWQSSRRTSRPPSGSSASCCAQPDSTRYFPSRTASSLAESR
jgi:hypothetical protein